MEKLPQLPPLIKLPPNEWVIKAGGPGYFAVSVYARQFDGDTYQHFQKWSVLDFPNDLFGIEDLINAGLFPIYMAAVEQLKSGPATMVSGAAGQSGERG